MTSGRPKKPRIKKVCLWCHEIFEPYNNNSKTRFCSESCNELYHRAKQKIFKDFQFADFEKELAKLDSEGTNYRGLENCT